MEFYVTDATQQRSNALCTLSNLIIRNTLNGSKGISYRMVVAARLP